MYLTRTDGDPVEVYPIPRSRFSSFDNSRRYRIAGCREDLDLYLADRVSRSWRIVHGNGRDPFTSASYAPDTGILAAARKPSIVLHQERASGEFKVTHRVRLAGSEAHWVRTASRRAVIVSSRNGRLSVSWVDITSGGMVLEPPRTISLGARPPRNDVYALSPDTRYFAAGLCNSDIVVVDLETGTRTDYDGHTDDIRLVAFSGDSQRLITADDDSRVIIRPRRADGFVHERMRVELTKE